MTTALWIGGVHYCPSAKSFFSKMLTSGIPFLYLPYNFKISKQEYWKSLSEFMSDGASNTFPVVMLLVGDKHKNWKKNISDDEIFNYILTNPKEPQEQPEFQNIKNLKEELRKTFKTKNYKDRFEFISDNHEAWSNFKTDTAFVYYPI
jgi:hypothetical protein